MDSEPSDPATGPHPPAAGRQRRPRYRGTHPRRFEQRYKEHQAEQYPDIIDEVRSRGGTPAGTHVPILLHEVMEALRPDVGETVVDCTLGYGGHAAGFLERIGPSGRLIAFDLDREQLERTEQRLRLEFPNYALDLHHGNYAGLDKPLRHPDTSGPDSPGGYDVIFADLGVSSMQIDDPTRGFSYKFPGALDMRMDRDRPRTAADLLASLSESDLTGALIELGDERDAPPIARAIVAFRSRQAITHTSQLARIVLEAKGFSPRNWRAEQLRREGRSPRGPGERLLHPAARTFQALRIMVNDELSSLAQLLRTAPYCLTSGGRIGIITFHNGEDRLVERAFREGHASGMYVQVCTEPIRPSSQERHDNPRSRSARLRWARRPDNLITRS